MRIVEFYNKSITCISRSEKSCYASIDNESISSDDLRIDSSVSTSDYQNYGEIYRKSKTTAAILLFLSLD